MKTLLSIATAVTLTVSSVLGATPFYKGMVNVAGSAATPAYVIFPAVPGNQFRLTSITWGSDTNINTLSCSSGTAMYNIIQTNLATSSITNAINSTNGLFGGATVVLQHGGTNYLTTVSTWNCSTNPVDFGATNVVLAAGGWGVFTKVGDTIYLMEAATTSPLGMGTNRIDGETVFVDTYAGRPTVVKISPCQWTNQIFRAFGHYDNGFPF